MCKTTIQNVTCTNLLHYYRHHKQHPACTVSFFFLPWITVARVKTFHICTHHTTATVIVGRKIVSQKNHVRWISIATSNCGWLEHDACSKRVLRVWYSPHLRHFFCCTRIAFEASATRSHHMHAADCGAKQIFFNLFDKSKAKLEKVRKVQASPPLGRKNTRAGPFCTWQPTLGTGLLLGLAFLKGYLYLGFQPARAYCMHKDGSSIFRKKKGRPDLLFLGLADMAN